MPPTPNQPNATDQVIAERAAAHWLSGPPKWAAVGLVALSAAGTAAWTLGREARIGPSSAPIYVLPPQSTALGVGAPGAGAPGAGVSTPGQQQAAGAEARSAQAPPSVRAVINLNTATQAELELLPGVGPALAKRIIEDRTVRGPYRRVEDLDRVKGIGPRLMERIRPLAKVDL